MTVDLAIGVGVLMAGRFWEPNKETVTALVCRSGLRQRGINFLSSHMPSALFNAFGRVILCLPKTARLFWTMSAQPFSRRRIVLYVIPILIGMGGVVFSQQWDNLAMRSIVLLASVSVPLFAGGSLWARFHATRLERLVLFAGVLMLIVGAALSVSGFSDVIQEKQVLPDLFNDALRLLGAFSLLLGLFVVLYTVVRTGEDLGQIAERFQHLAEHISEGLILSSADGTIFMVNKQFLEMFGFRQDEIIGKNSSELALSLNADRVIEEIGKRERGIASEYEITWRVHNEERRFWFKGAPIYDRHGRHTAILATVRDITEHHRLSQRVERYAQGLQKLVEEQTQKLQVSEERFRQLLLSMNEGFITIDTEHRIRFANDRICKMLRIPPERILDRVIFDFVDPISRVRLINLFAQGASAKHSEFRQELTFVDSGGLYVPSITAITHIGAGGEKEPVYSLVITNLAEQKQMQHQLELRARELERANEELRLHDRAKDSFLSNVSHELRTPLSTVQGYVEMLESGSLGAIPDPQQSALKIMKRNVERLAALINEMIEFSRMEIRGVQIAPDLFSPARLAREAAASIHPLTLAKDISVNLFVEDHLPHAWGDREKLGQVLGIFLNNAAKFTEPGGMIQIRVFSQPEHALAIAISDTGIGIDPAHQEKIFAKFYQVDSSKTRRYEGAGIGLSIAKSIVEAHQGRIVVDSAPGKGSTFTITLPHALFSTDCAPEDLADFSQLMVLCVNPVPESQGAIATFLESAGCRMHSAPNGYECFRSALESPPDLILMNEASVAETKDTIARLRQHEATEHIPVIVFARVPPDIAAPDMTAWEAVHYLKRPFAVHTLVEHIRDLCFGEPILSPAAGNEEISDAEYRPRVLIIDQDPCLLEWVEMALHHRHIPCGCAANVADALRIAEQHPPDIIFLDVDIPGAHAPEADGALAQHGIARGTPLYIMTGLPDNMPRSNGVAGMIRKPFTIDELLKVVQAVVRKRVHAPERVLDPASRESTSS